MGFRFSVVVSHLSIGEVSEQSGTRPNQNALGQTALGSVVSATHDFPEVTGLLPSCDDQSRVLKGCIFVALRESRMNLASSPWAWCLNTPPK